MQTFSVLELLRVLDDFVQHGLVLFEFGFALDIVLPLNELLNGLSLVGVLLFLLLFQELFGRHASVFVNLLNLVVKLFDVVSLSSQKLGHVSFHSSHLQLGLKLCNLLEPINVRIGIAVESDTSENSLLVLVLAYNFGNFLLNNLKGLMLSISLFYQLLLFLHKL